MDTEAGRSPRSSTKLTRRAALGLAIAGLAPALIGCTPPFGWSARGVFVADRDGEAARRVADGSPWLAWSADGQELGLRYDDGRMLVARADGSGVQPLTSGAFFGPGWSPSGTELAVIDPARNEIRIEASDGAAIAVARLRDELPPLWMEATPADNIPAWSPDGSRIAFLAWDGNGDELYTIDRSGGDRRQITSSRASQNRVDRHEWLGQRVAETDLGAPAWSPAGDYLAYALYPEVRGANGGIFIAPRNGGWRARVTNQVPTSGPVWSPNGRQLAYSAREEAHVSIFVADANGENRQNLTSSLQVSTRDAAWSPDGLRIAFAGGGDLYVMHASGIDQQRIAGTELAIRRPLWSPDGERIAFLGIPAQPGRG